MGRKVKLSAGRHWFPAMALAITLVCAAGMAVTGYLIFQGGGPSPHVATQPGPAAAPGIQDRTAPPADESPEADLALSAPVPSAPPAPRPGETSPETTGAAGAGTVRASFTVVAPQGN